MNDTGLCCRCFQLPYSPEESYKKIKESRIFDGPVLLEILRYIGHRPWTFANYSKETVTKTNPSRLDKRAKDLPLDIVRFFGGEGWRPESLRWAADRINAVAAGMERPYKYKILGHWLRKITSYIENL